MSVDGTRIDDLPPENAMRDFQVPAMKEGNTARLSISSILGLTQIGDVGGLSTALGNKANSNDVATALAGKSDKADTSTHALTAKTTPADADEFRIADSAATWSFKRLTWSNIKAAIKAFFGAAGDAPVFACRAWVNFNGTGTVAIRASGNVTSITDNGVGAWTVNLTTAMPDANYAAVVSSGAATDTSSILAMPVSTRTTTSFTLNLRDIGGTQKDSEYVGAAIFR
jgi:hypothetical protein